MNDDLLDCLLSAEQELEENDKQLNNVKNKKPGASAVHTGDTDSSDDEDNRDFENRKYNDFGKSIKRMLEDAPEKRERTLHPTWQSSAPKKVQTQPKIANTPSDVYTDPVFGMRITKPMLSHATLQDRMQGRDAVPMIKVRRYIELLTPQKDWVVAGAIVHKMGKTSQKGNQFAIWTLSDLHGDLKTITLFLFGSAYKELWKCIAGTIVGVLNPNVFEKKKDSKDEACLSVDNYQRVMILGQSKDLGTCKSVKKNGDKCTAFVNTNRCEFCIYHIKMEYQKCSKRSELQANFQGRGLTALRNKVLGKNEVFYAGKSYSAIPSKKSQKLVQKDAGRLSLLSGVGPSPNNVTTKKNPQRRKQAVNVELSANQRMKDMELLKRLGGASDAVLNKKTEFAAAPSEAVTLEDSKSAALSVIAKLKSKEPKSNPAQHLATKSSTQPTLIESKRTALDVISKLKSKNMDRPEEPHLPEKIDYGNILDEDNLSDIEFNLSDNEIDHIAKANNVIQNNTKIAKVQKQITEKPTNDILKIKDQDLNSSDDNILKINRNIPANKIIKENVDKSHKVIATDPKAINTQTKTPNKSMNGSNKKTGSELTSIVNKQSKTFNDLSPKVIPSKTDQINSNSVNKPHIAGDVAKRFPTLGNGFPSLLNPNKAMIDLSSPIIKKPADRAKMNALKWVHNNGPIKKVDPNNKKVDKGRKRALEIADEIDPKKQKIQENDYFSDRFKKMMAATSKHTDLVQKLDDEEQEKYFNKLAMKERMEDKMMTTYKIECKAVRCLQCKYTSFSAADRCKEERHPLKVFDAMKRFFKCGDCGNRMVTLDVVPMESCKNCGSGKWERTTMMKEKKVTGTHSLSIRGGEQNHTNSAVTEANVNLMVPDE